MVIALLKNVSMRAVGLHLRGLERSNWIEACKALLMGSLHRGCRIRSGAGDPRLTSGLGAGGRKASVSSKDDLSPARAYQEQQPLRWLRVEGNSVLGLGPAPTGVSALPGTENAMQEPASNQCAFWVAGRPETECVHRPSSINNRSALAMVQRLGGCLLMLADSGVSRLGRTWRRTTF
jgi:hypothetical protein